MRMLGDPPAASVAFDRELERTGGDHTRPQRQRVKRPFSQTRLSDERSAVWRLHDQRHVVGQLSTAVSVAVGDDPFPAFDFEPERPQQRAEHGVGLKAIPAPAAVQESPDERVLVQGLVLAQLHGEILVRYARHKRTVDGAKAPRRQPTAPR